MTPRVLVLHVRKEYFDQIKAGKKKEEYREIKDYWTKRLFMQKYDAVVIMKGYPKFSEMCEDNCIDFLWTGYDVTTIRHKEFGQRPVSVYAIKLVKE